nr:hypothetical protein [Candidatus Protofrankia californiensis]
MVNFHVVRCSAYLAAAREEPVDQLVSADGAQRRRLIGEGCGALSVQRDTTETCDQWFPAVAALDGDLEAGSRPNGAALRRSWSVEAVEFDASGDVDHAGFVGPAGGEVAGFLGLAGAGAVGAVPDERRGSQDLEEEGGQCQVTLVRGESPP